jgi:tetratricopeptide (TPR) repeat protein
MLGDLETASRHLERVSGDAGRLERGLVEVERLRAALGPWEARVEGGRARWRRRDPGEEETRLAVTAIAHLEQGRGADALASVRARAQAMALVGRAPEVPAAHRGDYRVRLILAEAALAEGRPAAGALGELVERFPRWLEAGILLARAQLEEDPDAAIATLNGHLAGRPRSARLFLERGVARHVSGNLSGAAADYTTGQARAAMASGPEEAAMLREAIADYESALKIVPDAEAERALAELKRRVR